MVHYVYIHYSRKWDRYYIGYSMDPDRRLKEHNTGHTTSTRNGIPWELVYCKPYSSKREAVAMERRLKRMKNRTYLQWFIQN